MSSNSNQWKIVERGQWKSIKPKKYKDFDSDFLGLEELTDYSLVNDSDIISWINSSDDPKNLSKNKHSTRKPKQIIKFNERNKIACNKNVSRPIIQKEAKSEEIIDQIVKKKQGNQDTCTQRTAIKKKAKRGEIVDQIPIKRKKNKCIQAVKLKNQELDTQEQVGTEICGKRKYDRTQSNKFPKKRKLAFQKENDENVAEEVCNSSEEFDKDKFPNTNAMDAWKNLFVPSLVLKVLWEKGFTTPTPIQSLVLPSAIRDKKDIIGAAETGSGKTLAFGIPLIYHILKDKEENNVSDDENTSDSDDKGRINDSIEGRNNFPQNEGDNRTSEDDGVSDELELIEEIPVKKKKLHALILSPTRELAIQVKDHLMVAAKYTGIKVAAVVGGMASEKQERILKRCPEIVVATPGRLWELIEQGEPHLSTVTTVKYLVIDEADRMVEKGHFSELLNLLEKINGNKKMKLVRQTYIFSATLMLVHKGPNRLRWKQKKFQLTSKQKITSLMLKIGIKERPKVIDLSRKAGTAETLTEMKINCSLEEKDYYLYYILTKYPGRTLVFTNSIDCIRRLNPILTILQRQPLPLHANMHQKQRLKNLERFSNRENGLLLATDVAARGLDIPDVQHVIHYQIPRVAETYIHRSGRTARAQKKGLSVMLIGPEESHFYRQICKTLNRDKDLQVFPVDMKILTLIKERVSLACAIDKMEHTFRAKKNSNEWFRKSAEEIDMELDEDDFLCDLGDVSGQNKRIKDLRNSLSHLLKRRL